MPSGDGNVLTIHTNDGTERFRIDSSGNVKVGSAATISPDGDLFVTGVCTATTLAGAASGLTGTLPAISGANLTNLPAANVTGTLPAISGANLTNLTASNLTGALPAISGANLTGIAATDNVRTGILDVAGIATFRSDVNIPNINGGKIGGRRNIIINGAMRVNQRSGTYNRASGDEFTVDRFKTKTGSSFNFDTLTTQATDAPSGFTNSLKITPQSTQTPSGSENATIKYTTEGQDCDALAHGTSDAKQVTLSFYAKSASSNNNQVYTVQLAKRTTGGSRYYLTQTFTVTSSWQRFTMSFAADTTNNLKNDNTEGMTIEWHLASGPDDIVSAQATWLSNNGFRAATGQSNFMDNTSNEFYLTGVQLEVGSTATAFEHLSYGEELSLCQRYYYVSGTPSGGGGLFMYDSGQTATSYGSLRFTQTMRATPTVVLRDNNGNTDGKATQHGASHDISATAADINTNGFSKVNKSSGNWSTGAGNPIICGCTADAEL